MKMNINEAVIFEEIMAENFERNQSTHSRSPTNPPQDKQRSTPDTAENQRERGNGVRER